MGELIRTILLGVPIGCVYALIAIGIVLTYKTSGVLNLAFGAQAFVSAALFYVLHDDSRLGWPMVPSAIVAVFLAAPAIGWLLDRALYRHLRTATPLTKLVTSLGLLVAIPQLMKLDFLLGSQPQLRPQGLSTEEVYRVGDLGIDGNQITTIVITALAVVGLTILFRSTNLGLQMRAVVESPRMAELAGVNANRVGTFSWMLSSFFAGLAGVLVAPLFGQVTDMAFFTLLVAALAAAAFGKLSSIPLTLLGGILLGSVSGLFTNYLPSDNILSTGIRQALPFAALFLLLLFWPGLRQRRETTDPLASVDPPPPAPAHLIRPRNLTISTRALAVVVVAGFVLWSLLTPDASLVRTFTQGLILSLIFLSITVVTGFSGQISLCQTAFAAVGAFGTAQIVSRTNMSVLLAILLAAAISAVVAALIALPALRLSGIYLALATLAFAVMFETVLVPQSWVSGGTRPIRVPRPLLFGIDFGASGLGGDKAYLLLCLVLLGIVGGIVLLVKFGTTGRFFDALRGSETAAAAIGINPGAAKVMAFAISGAIAGFGGGLIASLNKSMSQAQYQTNFNYFIGLVWVVLVVSLGSRSVQAAINAGMSFFLFPIVLQWIIEHLPVVDVATSDAATLAQTLAFILFGFGAITYAKHPEGVIESSTRRSIERITRRRGGGETPPDGPAASPPRAPAVVDVTTPAAAPATSPASPSSPTEPGFV